MATEEKSMKKIFIIFLVSSICLISCSKENNIHEKIETISESITEKETTNSDLEIIQKKNIQNSEDINNIYDGTACFDLVGINYHIPGESFYPSGTLYLVFKNYETDFGGHLYKILDSMPIIGIEQESCGTVTQGDLFKVHTFLPGGGTVYKFSFENGKLLKYVMDMPEGDFNYEPEYYLDETFEFENVTKVKLEEITVIK